MTKNVASYSNLALSLKIKDEEQSHKKNNAISRNILSSCEEHSQTATAAALLKSSRFTNLTHALIFAHSHVCSKMRVDIKLRPFIFDCTTVQ